MNFKDIRAVRFKRIDKMVKNGPKVTSFASCWDGVYVMG